MRDGNLSRWPRTAALGLGVTCSISLLVAASAPSRGETSTRQSRADSTPTEPVRKPADASEPTSGSEQVESEAADWADGGQLANGLIGSKHDFRSLNESVRDLCFSCHTPHLVSAPSPLLDRRTTTTPPLRPYRGVNMELTGWSLLCLGCHDGITAQSVYSTAHATQLAGQLGNSRLGSKWLRSHPVGTLYPLAAEEYEPRAAVETAGLPLPDGRVQCTTCHDAHNTRGYQGMLRISNERSRLCLTCHRH